MDTAAAVVLAAAGLCLASCVAYALYRVRRFSRSLFGDADLAAAIKAQLNEAPKEPKSVSAMTGLCLPQIARDFPGFNYPVFRKRTETMLRSYFAALDAGDPSLLVNASADLRIAVRAEIEEAEREGRDETVRDAVIHRTEIARYEKRGGVCAITIQSSVGYMRFTADRAGEVIAGDSQRRAETRFDVELVYVRDAADARGSIAMATGLSCPNCGAPITNLGNKTCAYCGSAVRENDSMVWLINAIRER